MNKLLGYMQYLTPQHLLTNLVGRIAESKKPWLKEHLTRWFINKYQVDMEDALIENPDDYPTFNDLFIRKLKPELRPIVVPEKTIASPVDGTVAKIGAIDDQQLLQAKGMYFNLKTLLGNDEDLSKQFSNGQFTTLYLAPHNYHRVHMPLTGRLQKCIYVPGNLFSVNKMTSKVIPNLYARNERLICVFETEAGLMTLILVGALIVGSMQTVWMDEPIKGKKIQDVTPSEPVTLKKGDELGYFKMGSTVIVLFQSNRIHWQSSISAQNSVQFGQWLGSF